MKCVILKHMEYENQPKETENNKRRKPVLTIVLAVLCIVLIATNLFTGAVAAISLFSGGGRAVNKGKVNRIMTTIDRYYMGDYSKADLSESAYKGIVEGLNDPYSAYLTKEEYRDFKVEQNGNYSGIGAALVKDADTGYVKISNVYDESPAKKAGLIEGDLILSADGNKAADMDVSDFAAIIRGEKGTKVSLVVLRDGKELEFSIERGDIKRNTVSYTMLDEKVGYIAISEFIEDTADQFDDAVENLLSQGMEAVIYDVRSNPGGLVDSVTDILDTILPGGVVVYTEDKDGNRKDYKSAESSKVDLPAVVLINESSASSSEIFAGAMRDFEYATLIGTNTFGKGVVQTILDLGDGSAMRLTFANYFTPKGENIHKKGIAPDIELKYKYSGDPEDEFDYKKDNQIQKALEVLEGK